MMVDEELREEEVDGNNNTMDFECEWYFALKTIDELV